MCIRDRYNKVGGRHYAYASESNFEMYARKVALLQVLKYMPSSIELSNALTVSHAAEEGKGVVIEGDFVTVDQGASDAHGADSDGVLPELSAADFDKKKAGWEKVIKSGAKSVNDLIATIQTKEMLTDEQKMEIAAWAVQEGGAA